MRWRRALVCASAVQLAAGVAGHVLAVREQRAFDIAILRWKGRRDRVAHDTLLLGTGVSPPVFIFVVQALATAVLATRASRAAARTLGFLGAAMSLGYLVEREFRAVLANPRAHPTLAVVAAAGFGLSTVMAALGLRARHAEG